MLVALLIALGLATLLYVLALVRAALAERASPTLESVILGACTNFFDTLGIGSFAPTMAWFKFRRLVPDRLIPCTLIVGHTLPTMVQGIIFLAVLDVDPVLLVGCVLAFLIGGLFGVRLVIHAPRVGGPSNCRLRPDPGGHLLCLGQFAPDARRGNCGKPSRRRCSSSPSPRASSSACC